MILSKLARVPCPGMVRMSPPLRASNEGLLRPRVARAQGTHRAIPSPAEGPFQHPSPFAQLHRQRLPGKYAVQVGMAIRGSGDKFDGFVDTNRRAAAG